MPGVLVLLVAIAGALGAVCRYGLGLAVGPAGSPWTTLGVNVAGSFLLGVLVAAVPVPDGAVRVAIGTGFLGAFTTFSAFSLDSLTLARDGQVGPAVAYALASLTLGIGAAAAGLLLGQLAR